MALFGPQQGMKIQDRITDRDSPTWGRQSCRQARLLATFRRKIHFPGGHDVTSCYATLRVRFAAANIELSHLRRRFRFVLLVLGPADVDSRWVNPQTHVLQVVSS